MVGMDNGIGDNLKQNILKDIRKSEYCRARALVFCSVFLTVVSLVGVWGSISYLFSSLYESSFVNYLSLLFSDPDVVLMYWQQFVLSLLESLPVVGMVLSLVALASLLVSFRVLVVNMKFGLRPVFSRV